MRIVRIILLAVLVGAAAVGLYVYQAWNELSIVYGDVPTPKRVSVKHGMTTEQILSQLAQEGLIKRSMPLKLYVKLKLPTINIKAGNYTFKNAMTPIEVLERLQQGPDQLPKVTIVEGWARWDIANELAAFPSWNKKPGDLLKLINDPSGIRDLDKNADSLEGYMFPDTYFIAPENKPKDILAATVRRFKEIWNARFAERAKAVGMTPHQVITVASIIETEAKLAEERPIVASVIYNRLKKKMRLGVDSTIVYASKLAGAWKYNGKVYQSDIDRKSPYNTRINFGLPPAPVGCPGASSIDAALNPRNTGYLYYVRNPDRNDGAHNFYVSEKDFEVGVQALRAWEEKQKKAAAIRSKPH